MRHIYYSNVANLIGIAIGLIGIGLAIYFGVKQKNAKKVLGVFVNAIQNQAQSVCKSLEDLKNGQNTNFDWLKGRIEGTYDNMAALNGTIINFHKEFYGKIKGSNQQGEARGGQDNPTPSS
jgi:uncharacterized membrane protein YvbJ